MIGKYSRIAVLVTALALPFSVPAMVKLPDTGADALQSPITGSGIIGSASLQQAEQRDAANTSCADKNAIRHTVSSQQAVETAQLPDKLNEISSEFTPSQSSGCCWVYWHGQWICVAC